MTGVDRIFPAAGPPERSPQWAPPVDSSPPNAPA